MRVWAVLLAAGESTRMGEFKQLALFDQEPLLLHALRPLLATRLGGVVLVLGHRYHEILNRVRIRDPRVKVVLNRQYEKGMATSLRAGVRALPAEAEAALVALGDQPFLEAAVVERLLDALEEGSRGIVVPVYQGRRGHPVIFHRRYFRDLEHLQGDQGGSPLLKKYSRDILRVEVPWEGVVRDVDRPEDLEETWKERF